MSNPKPQTTLVPSAAEFESTNEKDEPLKYNGHSKYRSVVGGVFYAALYTRPEIAFATGVLARLVQAPCMRHFNIARRMLRYIYGTDNQALFYGRGNGPKEPLEAYRDSDWARWKNEIYKRHLGSY